MHRLFLIGIVLLGLVAIACADGYGSTSGSPALSCQDVLLYNGGASSGTYWITLNNEAVSVWCDFSNPTKAWTMVYKISAGVGASQSDSPQTIWTSKSTNYRNASVANPTANAHYRNSIIDNWASVQKVAVHIYVNSTRTVELVFNPGTTNTNWFGPDYLISSPWSDVPRTHGWDLSAQGRYFSLIGDMADNRAWYINNNWGGCPSDNGWLIISYGGDTCSLFYNSPLKPAIIYSQISTMANWQTPGQVGYATSFVVLVQQQEPLSIPAWSSADFTFYIGNNTNLSSVATVDANSTAKGNSFCRFATSIVPAIIRNQTIECYTPPLPGGKYGFSYSIDGEVWYATATQLLVRSIADSPTVQDVFNDTPLNITWTVDPSMGDSVDVRLLLYITAASLDRAAPGPSGLILVDAGVLFSDVPNDGSANIFFPTINSTVVAAYALAVVPHVADQNSSSSRKRFDSNIKFTFDWLVDKAWDKVVEYSLEAEELIPKPLLKIIAVGRAINAIGAVVEAVTEYCHGSFCGDEYLCSSLQKEGRGANVAPEDPIDAACKNYYQCQQENLLNDGPCIWQYRRDLSAASNEESCFFNFACQVSGFYHFVSSFLVDPLLREVSNNLQVQDIPYVGNPGSGGGWGDVHYTSIDGCYFTYNGVGDFTLLEAATTSLLYYDFVMQVRTLPFERFPSAALTAAVAIKASAISTPIALYPSSGDAEVYLDGSILKIAVGITHFFRGGSILKSSAGVFELDFDSGFTVKLGMDPVAPNFFWTVAVAIPPSAYNRTRGILGLWDNNPHNDFLLRNRTSFADCAYSLNQINEFGDTWAIQNNTSLFFTVNYTLPSPESNSSVIPVSEPQFASPEQQALAEQLCAGLPDALRTGCLFDISVMNVSGVANATGVVSQTFSALSTIPKNLTVAYVTNTSLTVDWELGDGSTPSSFVANVTYEVMLLNQGVWINVPYFGNTSVVTLYNLLPNVTYNLKIRALFASGDASAWSQASFATLACLPICPNDGINCGDGCGGVCSCTPTTTCTDNTCAPIPTTTTASTSAIATTTGAASTSSIASTAAVSTSATASTSAATTASAATSSAATSAATSSSAAAATSSAASTAAIASTSATAATTSTSTSVATTAKASTTTTSTSKASTSTTSAATTSTSTTTAKPAATTSTSTTATTKSATTTGSTTSKTNTTTTGATTAKTTTTTANSTTSATTGATTGPQQVSATTVLTQSVILGAICLVLMML